MISSSYNRYIMIQLSEHHNEPHQYTTRAVGQHLLLLAALIRRSSGENLFWSTPWDQSIRHCSSILKPHRGVYSCSPGIWAARARKVDKAKSYNYVTRALANVKEKNVRDQKVFKVNRSIWYCCLYVEAEGAVGGEKNDQGGELCLLLANDGEAHTQPVIQVHDGCLEYRNRRYDHNIGRM